MDEADGWRADPSGRHEHRLFAAGKPTPLVANQGVQAWDPDGATEAPREEAPVTPPPAGWLPDPTDGHSYRYWDGSAWTDHVSPAPAATAPPGVAIAIPTVAAHSDGARKRRILVAVPAALLVIGVVTLLVLNGSSPPANDSGAQAAAGAAKPSAPAGGSNPGADPAVQSWWSQFGHQAAGQLVSDLQTIHGDATNDDVPALLNDCETLITDASAVGVGPHIPNSALEVTWATGIADLLSGSHDWMAGLSNQDSGQVHSGTALVDQGAQEIGAVGAAINGGSATSPATTPPTTEAPAPTTTTPVYSPPTTVPCPTGSPGAQVSMNVSSFDGIDGEWTVSLTGTFTNPFTVPIALLSVNVQVQGDASSIPNTEFLYAGGGAGTIVAPGQTVQLSGAAEPYGPSQRQPTVGTVTTTWNWASASPYMACPTGT